MKWRLGLDLGTNSIGWSVLEITDNEIPNLIDLGVRIFSDGRLVDKSGNVGDSLAVDRRMARGMRKQRFRTKMRKRILIKALVETSLFPTTPQQQKQLESLSPYEMRSRAAIERIEPYQLGRALFHLAVNRGYKSNRKTDGEEEGAFFDNIENLNKKLENKTLGQYLFERYQAGERTRFSKEDGCDIFPRREMYENEFGVIRLTQQVHQNLTSEQWDNLQRIIFFQRPLKPVERGKCTLFSDEERAFEGLPASHTFRIIQDINNLRWIDDQLIEHPLNEDQRAIIFEKLNTTQSTKISALKNLKGKNKQPLFPDCQGFNLERGGRKELKGHKINCDFKKETFFGANWDTLPEIDKNNLVESLYLEDEEDTLIAHLMEEYKCSEEQALNLSKYPLPRNKTMRLSRKAMEALLPVMRDQGLRYDEAVSTLTNEFDQPMDHAKRPDGVIFDRLPYYGEALPDSMQFSNAAACPNTQPEEHFGKIANPTVHIALNQLRKIVNSLIGTYGKPEEIHVELSRDLKNSRDKRDKITQKNRENERDRTRIFKNYFEPFGFQNPTAHDYKKVQLWEELKGEGMTRVCPYSGDPISFEMLMNGEAQIEHILPFSRTLDNSRSNLTVATVEANHKKGNQSPYEAFGNYTHDKFAWPDILARVSNLPGNKQWRFSETAMQRYMDEENGFIARQLTDNAYLSTMAAEYLGKICNPNKIVSVSGQLTALLRGVWGLNRLLNEETNLKNRDDHRHHAVDAFVVALTTRSLLQKVSTAKNVNNRQKILLPELPEQLEKQITDKIQNVFASIKPDHSHQSKLFKETAYGLIPEQARSESHKDHNTVVRKALTSLTRKNLEDIRDPVLRAKIIAYVDSDANTGRKLEKVLADFQDPETISALGLGQIIKNVRVLEKWQTVQPIKPDKYSDPTKGYVPDSYACCHIWRIPRRKAGKYLKNEFEWKGEFYSHMALANFPADKNKIKPHPAAKLELIIYKDDVLEIIDIDDTSDKFKVFGFSTTNNKLDLRPLNATNTKQTFYSINQIMRKSVKKAHRAF